MTQTWIAVAAAAIVVAVGALVAAARLRARSRAIGERIAHEIEPYLRRKAAEAGIEVTGPVWTSRHSAEARAAYSAGLAGQLLDHERNAPADTSSTALAQTVPADSVEDTAPRSPRALK